MNLTKRILKALAASSLLLFAAGIAEAEHTRVTNPNTLGVELLGQGLLYSIRYDRVMNDDLAAGFGYGTAPTTTAAGEDTDVHVSGLPVYVNYYFTRDQGSLFLTGGATIITNSDAVTGLQSQLSATDLEFSSSPILGSIGLGYENRGDMGFLFRATAYGLIAKTISPWIGFSFGYSF